MNKSITIISKVNIPYKKPFSVAFAYTFQSNALPLFFSLRIARVVDTTHTIGKTTNNKIIASPNNRIPSPIAACNCINKVVKTCLLIFFD